LAEQLREAGIDCFFAQSPVTMGYLHGFHEGSIERFLTLAINSDGQVRMICPALSASQAKRSGIEDVRSWKDGEDPLVHLSALALDWDLKSAILAVDDEMPAQMLLKMQSALPAALFKPGQPVLSNLMRRKEPQEMEMLRKAGRIADEAFEAALSQIKAGMTEQQVARVLSDEMANRGGRPTFAIVAAGANGAEPHHLSDDTPIQPNDVLILDFGCEVGGYLSDITRTICVGHASDEEKKVYEIVYRSHMAGREAVRSGVTCESVDAAARKVIDDAGYGEFFFHRTGHGIGMRGHEEPYMIAGNQELLEPGNCFSVEPGIYLAGRFGVRVENIVAATQDGHESMNAEPSPVLIELS
jgi:Xaa-Pro dipeptidase